MLSQHAVHQPRAHTHTTYTCARTHTCTCAHTCTHTTCAHTHITCARAHTRTHTYTCPHACPHTHARTHTHVHTCASTHAHKHAQAHSCTTQCAEVYCTVSLNYTPGTRTPVHMYTRHQHILEGIDLQTHLSDTHMCTPT